MGAGNKFNSSLSTRGGRCNFVTSSDISSRDSLAIELLNEMKKEQIKFSKEKIIFIAKLENGKKIFLEENALDHIKARHAKDFEKSFGVKENEIVTLISDTISKGKLVSSESTIINGEINYKNVYYYKGEYFVVCGISDNGYIETIYPSNKYKRRNR